MKTLQHLDISKLSVSDLNTLLVPVHYGLGIEIALYYTTLPCTSTDTFILSIDIYSVWDAGHATRIVI